MMPLWSTSGFDAVFEEATDCPGITVCQAALFHPAHEPEKRPEPLDLQDEPNIGRTVEAVAGAAAGAALVAVGAGGVAAVLIRDSLGWRLILTLMRCTVAAAVMGVALRFVMPAHPAFVLLAYPLAGVGYLLLLRVIGEITSDDVASVRIAFSKGG